MIRDALKKNVAVKFRNKEERIHFVELCIKQGVLYQENKNISAIYKINLRDNCFYIMSCYGWVQFANTKDWGGKIVRYEDLFYKTFVHNKIKYDFKEDPTGIGCERCDLYKVIGDVYKCPNCMDEPKGKTFVFKKMEVKK